MEVKLK